MPCSDSSSGINIKIDNEDRLVSFEFAKITCSSAIGGNTGYLALCQGRTLEAILADSFADLVEKLGIAADEEKQFVLHLEWEALRAAIVGYLGIDHPDVDGQRCQVTSIEHTEDGVEISEVILPPKELPKILPCSLGDQHKKPLEPMPLQLNHLEKRLGDQHKPKSE